MTPKEKCDQLIDKFTHAEGNARILTPEVAKACTLICAEECRVEAYKQGNALAKDREDFWYETIQGIEKL